MRARLFKQLTKTHSQSGCATQSFVAALTLCGRAAIIAGGWSLDDRAASRNAWRQTAEPGAGRCGRSRLSGAHSAFHVLRARRTALQRHALDSYSGAGRRDFPLWIPKRARKTFVRAADF